MQVSPWGPDSHHNKYQMRWRDIIREGRAKKIAVWSGLTITVLHNPTRTQFENFASRHRAIRGLLDKMGTDLWIWDGGSAVHSNLIQELGLGRADCVAYNDGKWSGPVHDNDGYYPAIERVTPYKESAGYLRSRERFDKALDDLLSDPEWRDLIN